MSVRVVSVAVGDELLDGRVADRNSQDLGDALAVLGLELQGARIVPDHRATVVAAIRDAAAHADIVVTSGGLGPTTDDLTAECVADAAGVPVVFHAPTLERMQAMFATRGMVMPESNRRQAMVPQGADVLENQQGTAPGLVTKVGSAEVWSFPGVPREYRHLLEDHLVPRLRTRLGAHGQGASVLVRRTLRSLGLAESAVGERLAALERDNPDVRVQYRVLYPEILVRVVVEGSDRGACEARAQALIERARSDIGASVYGLGDAPLEVRLHALLSARGESVSTAESCTGGIAAKRLTDVPGSSTSMIGGVVAYANSAKTALLGVRPELLAAHGAVSEQVAHAMAEGVRERLGTTWSVSVTGIAGPGGGTADKPVGLVVFGVAGPTGVVTVTKKLPDFGRERVREMAAATALRLLLERVEAHHQAQTDGRLGHGGGAP